MTLCICQLHHIAVYRTSFWVCIFVELSVIMCLFTNAFIEFFHHDSYDYYWDMYGHFYFELHV